MPKRVLSLPISQWVGINYMADSFQLRDDEVADALNVDFDPTGGFARRDSVQAYNQNALGSIPRNAWAFFDSTGTYSQLIVQNGNDAQVVKATGAHTAINPDALTTNGIMYAATAGDKCYIQRNAENAAFTWTGAATAVLTDSHGAYVDDYAAPVGGKMPKAKYICMHHTAQMLFHANVVEAGTAKKSRVRFSHPTSDATATKGWEDYRTNDWIDVGAGDGDYITGLASWGERLLIFKTHSLWELRGYSADTFSLHCVSHSIGALEQHSIAVGDEGVYFFSYPHGLQLYDGNGIKDLFYPMNPFLDVSVQSGIGFDDLNIDSSLATKITVGYVNQRVWVSVPTAPGPGYNNATLVYDPRLGRSGGWTRYDLPLSSYVIFQPPGVADTAWYACHANSTSIIGLHASNGLDALVDGNFTPVESYAVTKFFDLGNPALQKRWKHPIIVCDADNTVTLGVDVFRDYSLQTSFRHFDVLITGAGTGFLWGTGSWGTGTWGGTAAGAQSIEKGGLLGRGTAVALKISGPAAGDLPWSVNGITFKYIPRRIRS